MFELSQVISFENLDRQQLSFGLNEEYAGSKYFFILIQWSIERFDLIFEPINFEVC